MIASVLPVKLCDSIVFRLAGLHLVCMSKLKRDRSAIESWRMVEMSRYKTVVAAVSSTALGAGVFER